MTGRPRRTKAEMEVIRAAIVEVLIEHQPMTVRQVFYALTTRDVIAKTEAEYKTVVRLLGDMRRDGTIPYTWLADATRWMRKPTTFSSVEEALRRTAETYRRALWDDADTIVEVWLEKEALAGILVDITAEWGVPLMVTRGYPSMSYLHAAADAITDRRWQNRQRTKIYYFGDRDPSGLDIDRAVREGIGEAIWSMIKPEFREATPAAEFDYWADFERMAVTAEQITEWDLPTRPTKSTDTRSKSFRGDASVELDAIPPDVLRDLVRDAIEQHVDTHRLGVLRTVEAEERRVMEQIADTLNGDSGEGA
jgi:hypothetical protein